MQNLRGLIVDDSILFRIILADVLNKEQGLRVAGFAKNGKEALEKIRDIDPDFITLDIEMPEMNGLETLKTMRESSINTNVIMVSAYTKEGAEETIKALELGAFGFITKPDTGDEEDNKISLRDQLKSLMAGICAKNHNQSIHSHPLKTKTHLINRISSKPEIITIGISTGGPKALAAVIPKIPGDFPVPIVIVQHMPKLFTKSLAESLNKKSLISVKEAGNREVLKPGHAYIAPGGSQMKLSNTGNTNEKMFIVNDDPPENNCKPSVDYLFRSVAKIYKEKALGVLMTGMGSDGVVGLRLMKRHGVKVIIQDAKSCVVYSMPGAAKKAGVVDIELPLELIAEELIKSV